MLYIRVLTLYVPRRIMVLEVTRPMLVSVEQCYGGNDYYFRLEWRENGTTVRERVNGERWDRSTARQALDLLENVYGADRRRVRFQVR